MLMKIDNPVNAGVEMPPRKETVADSCTRLSIWEINHCFKCPIIGMCITLDEQKRLLKKLGLFKKNDSPFEMHETLVAAMDQENRLSRRIDSLLERKFSKKAAGLLQLNNDAFLASFKEAMASGEAGAVLWSTAVSPDLSTTCRRTVFGDIHMTMHWNGEQLMQLKRRLSRQQNDLDRLQHSMDVSSRQRRELKKLVNGYKRRNDILERELSAERKENSRLHREMDFPISNEDGVDELEQKNSALQLSVDALQQQVEQANQDIVELKRKNQSLISELARQHEANEHVRQETRTIIAEMASMNRCDESCPAFDLCKKRILVVGGITRMESLYRDLIESSNGVFEYHDGYVRKGARDLESSLKRADMILCPVNCNSHAACSIVKNMGKKHNKAVHILANASLSAVSRVIWGGASGAECSIN